MGVKKKDVSKSVLSLYSVRCFLLLFMFLSSSQVSSTSEYPFQYTKYCLPLICSSLVIDYLFHFIFFLSFDKFWRGLFEI